MPILMLNSHLFMNLNWLQFIQIYCLTRIKMNLHINSKWRTISCELSWALFILQKSSKRAYRLIPNVMDGAMKESMISFLDKNLSIRLAKVRRPIEGVTRYTIIILQCWRFCPRTVFTIHYVIEFVLVRISSVALLPWCPTFSPMNHSIYRKINKYRLHMSDLSRALSR